MNPVSGPGFHTQIPTAQPTKVSVKVGHEKKSVWIDPQTTVGELKQQLGLGNADATVKVGGRVQTMTT